jgi:RimJ/RimL family protein N-acetyltransferase
MLAWADDTLDADETVAIISIGNDPSIKLAERLGFERQPDGVYRDEPISLWRRRKPA